MTSIRSRKKEVGQDEVRCECGHLLAKLTSKGVEMKCRRCKRVHLLQVSATQPAKPRRPASEVSRKTKSGNEQN